MSTFRKTAALTGALATGVMAMSFVTAGSASASTVSGGWFSTSTACNQSGHNITSNPSSPYEGWSWRCTYVSSHNPHWHLVLIS
ncbi:hypothetical protein [Kribbella sindirgiensis]|uniref:Lactococcin 972 family bacteriocin n=1 Tax=Kribbella sindirgiensis TaxID=1124744 RepID=A0A4R0J9U0_9ACTN|nr:hypothetical protein [Kribbella sindirgiensis]TCC43513.1 hypothetical protein E0H50_03375 [Kribbella sindirgiensis]